MKKSTVSLILSICMLVSVFSTFTVYANELEFVDGHYVIDSADDFSKVTDMTGTYWIIKDIELSDNYVSIGTGSTPFKGKIFGRLDGKASQKPVITLNTKGSSGLIGTMSGGLVTNLIIKGNIESGNRKTVGSVVGLLLNGNIENCINYADITSEKESDVYIGGIVGLVKSAEENVIKNCENYGKIICGKSGNGSVGGIAGAVHTTFTTIKDCKNEGEIISSVKNSAGITGEIYGFISGCANFSDITNTKYIASGITAFCEHTINNSFNKGNITGTKGAAGIVYEGSAENVYNSGNITSGDNSSGITVIGTVKFSYNIGKIKGLNVYGIAPSSDNSNYALSDSKLSLEDFKSMEKLPSLNGIYLIDTESEYPYPQLVDNNFGTFEKQYIPFSDNRILVEAEDCELADGIYQVVDKDNAGGNKVLVCPKGNHITKVENIEKAALKFEFYAPEEKQYFVWIRARVESSSGDSIWYSMDNDDYTQCILGVDAANYQWFLITRKTFSEGVHTINLTPREYRNEIDKILISDTVALIPSGMGNADDTGSMTLIYPEPSVKPAQGHPRLWFTSDDIPRIKENLKLAEYQPVLKQHSELLKKDIDGNLSQEKSNNYDAAALSVIKAYAFEYAINGNEELGKKAVNAIINYVRTLTMPSSSYSQAGDVTYAIAIVYDWCYPLLTAENLNELWGSALYLTATYSQVKWPPTQQASWGGHGSESQLLRDLFSLGVATYDENPYIYNTVAGRLEAEYKEIRQLYYGAHKVPYGSDYLNHRFNGDVSVFSMMSRTTGKNFWESDDIRYVPYFRLYSTKPDGAPLAEGDFSIYNIASPEKYSNTKTPDYGYSLLGSYYQDGILRDAFLEDCDTLIPYNYLEYIICNDPYLEPVAKDNLPLSKYFGYPFSSYIARTGWNMGKNSPDVVVSMNMRELTVQDHMHQDVGEFEIYYKGNLATDSGYYQVVDEADWGADYWENYYHQTIAHNCMLIYDPAEPTINFARKSRNYEILNSGGQYDSSRSSTYDLSTQPVDEIMSDDNFLAAVVLGHEAGLDEKEPNYTYLKGDLSGAYSEKVKNYERSFMFLNLKNEEVPAALVVFDHVVSSNPSFKKTYLLHGINAPEINGTRTVLKRTENGYNGKLTNDTLLPKADDVAITQVGDNPDEFIVGDKVYTIKAKDGTIAEGGGIRTEISPVLPKNEDYFLNVMQMSDADSEKEPLEATLIESETHTGVKIADRVVLFGNLRDKVNTEVSFAFSGDSEYEITVSDLVEGTWEVKKDGEILCDTVVTTDGTIAAFNGSGGNYTLNYKTPEGTRQQVTSDKFVEKYIKIKINDYFLYVEDKPIVENGRILVPIRSITDALGGTINWDENKRTVYAERYGRTVELKEGADIAKVSGREVSLDVSAKIINGRVYVPLRFITEAFAAKITWNDITKIASIKDSAKAPEPGFKTVIDVTWDDGILVDSDGFNTIDSNNTTYWATGANEEGVRWICYEFAEAEIIKSIEIMWGRPHQRTFTYDILVSEDGINWVEIVHKNESLLVEEAKMYDYQTVEFPENTKAKYIKINGYGNNSTYANNIAEVRFK